MRTLLGRSANAALSVLAGLGVLCVVVTLAGVLFDVRALVFTSGSMSPTIETGALGLARPVEAADLEVGDIVSVPVGDSRVTHRITDLTLEGDRATLVLKGDANTVEDADTYPADSADRVFFHVPKLGYAVDALSGPVGVFLGGMLAAALLFLVFRPARRDTERGTGRHHAAVLAVLIMGVPAVLTAGRVTPTMAAWTDSGTLKGGTLGAVSQILAPANVTCVQSDGLGRDWSDATWPNTNPRVDYVAELWYAPNIGQDKFIRSIEVPNPVNGGVPVNPTMTLRFFPADLPQTSRYYKVIVYAHVKGAKAWRSPQVVMDKRFYLWPRVLVTPPYVTCEGLG